MTIFENGTITFDESLKEDMLFIFGIVIDDEGYLVENKQPNNRVLVDGRPILLSEFAGVMSKDGKPVILRNDIGSLIELVDKPKGE